MKIGLPEVGAGTARTSGTYIAALLQLEEESDRLEILADVLEMLGIDPDDVKRCQVELGLRPEIASITPSDQSELETQQPDPGAA